MIKQKVKEQEDAKDKEAKDGDDMNIDEDDTKGDDKKVSTSGYRTARHHLYKKK